MIIPISSIAGHSMTQLHTDVIFGIGAMFLYILVPTAILANESRLIKQSDDTSGASSAINGIAQGGFFITAWLVSITVLLFLLVGVGGHEPGANPGQGIYDFWAIQWPDPATMTSIKSNPLFNTDEQKVQAQTLVLLLSIAKVLTVMLLGVMLIVTINIAMWIPLQKMRRTAHYQMDGTVNMATASSFLMVFFIGVGMFSLVINLIDMLLTAVLQFSHKMTGLPNAIDLKVKVLDEFWKLLGEGLKNWDKYAAEHPSLNLWH